MAENKKLNLSSYGKKQSGGPILTPANPNEEEEKIKSQTKNEKTSVGGRPPKPPKERRTEKITINLTKQEKAAIIRKSGLIPEATFVLSILREAGLFSESD